MQVFEMMRKIISDMGMAGQVKFIGYVPDDLMASYYQNASMFVMPSLFEPFGMTTQEAMACGVPVIASKYGGIRTVISNKENGILVDPKDADEFAAEMIRLLTDEDWNHRIGKAGHELIREHYSWEVMAARHLEFYSNYSHLQLEV
jgi:glycosyltransferase involved in cell wall biosynthesis